MWGHVVTSLIIEVSPTRDHECSVICSWTIIFDSIHRIMARWKNTEMIPVSICAETFLWGLTSFLNMKTVHKWNMKVCDNVGTLDLRTPRLIFFIGQCKSFHQSQPEAFSPRLTRPSYFNRTVAGAERRESVTFAGWQSSAPFDVLHSRISVDRAHSPDDVPASHFIICAWKLWSSVTAGHDWQRRNRERVCRVFWWHSHTSRHLGEKPIRINK